MKITLGLYKSGGVLKNKEYPVKITIEKTEDGKRMRKRISLPFTSSNNDWNNKKKELFVSHSNYSQIMPYLLDLKLKISKIYISGETDFEKIKSILFKKSHGVNLEFFKFGYNFILSKKRLFIMIINNKPWKI